MGKGILSQRCKYEIFQEVIIWGIYLIMTLVLALMKMNGMDIHGFQQVAVIVPIVAGVAFLMMGNINELMSGFRMAVCCQRNRKHFLTWHIGFSLIESIMVFAQFFLMHILNVTIWGSNGAQREMMSQLDEILRWEVIFGGLLAIITIEIFSALMLLWLGNKGVWVLWGIWMVICFAPKKIWSMLGANNCLWHTMVKGYEVLGPRGVMVLGSIIGLLVVGFSFRRISRWEVNGF